MKAKEYATKLFGSVDKVIAEGDPEKVKKTLDEILSKILMEFMEEGKVIAFKRNVTNNHAVISIIKEQSDKWKAFAYIVNKKYNVDVIKPHGFKDYMIYNMPALKKYEDLI